MFMHLTLNELKMILENYINYIQNYIYRSVAKLTGDGVQLAGGTLQTCTGIEAGIEAPIHAMIRLFANDECEAILLVDMPGGGYLVFGRIHMLDLRFDRPIHPSTKFFCPHPSIYHFFTNFCSQRG